MAYISQTNLDDKDKEQKQNGQATPDANVAAPVSVSGGDASAGGGAMTPTSAVPSSTGPAGTKSGRFQNIQNYLDANKGYKADQGGLAGQTLGTLKDQKEQQENAIGGDANRITSNVATQNQGLTGEGLQNRINEATSNPYAYLYNSDGTLKQDNADSWKSLMSGTAQAPTGFDASGQLASNAQNFVDTAGLANKESGRMALLNKLYGKSGYTGGQQTLDNLFLQAQPNQLEKLTSGAQQLSSDLYGGENSAYNKYAGTAKTALETLKHNAEDASGVAKTALDGTISTAQGDLASRASAEQTKRDTQYAELKKLLGEGKITQGVLDTLGLSQGDISNLGPLYGANMGTYLNNNVGTVQAGNVATDADKAKFQALSQLASNPDLSNYLSGAKDLGKVGALDMSGLQYAAKSQKEKFDTDYSKVGEQSANLAKSIADQFKRDNLSIGMNDGLTVQDRENSVRDFQNLQNGALNLKPTGNPIQDAQNISKANAAVQDFLAKYHLSPQKYLPQFKSIGDQLNSITKTYNYGQAPKITDAALTTLPKSSPKTSGKPNKGISIT